MRTSGRGRHALLRPEQHMSTRSCWTAPSPPPSRARCRSPQVQWWCEAWSATWSCRHALALCCWLLLATVQYSSVPTVLYCAVLCRAVLCCNVLCSVVLCYAERRSTMCQSCVCCVVQQVSRQHRTWSACAKHLCPPPPRAVPVAAQLTTAACVSCQA